MNDIKTAGTDTRPSWDEYFMQMAELTAQRSTCLRRKVGAVIVKDKHIIATGYNGAPRGLRHCGDLGGCLRQKLGVPSGSAMSCAERFTQNKMRLFSRQLWGRVLKMQAFTLLTSRALSVQK